MFARVLVDLRCEVSIPPERVLDLLLVLSQSVGEVVEG
jgi:hypothetical protein